MCKELDDQIQLRNDIGRLEIEKTQSEKSAKEAHITITKNLEKIRQLEAKYNRLENEKSFERGLVQTNFSEQNTKLKDEKIEQDFILKEEYMENINDEKDNIVGFETQSENKEMVECLNFKKRKLEFKIEEGIMKQQIEIKGKGLELKQTEMEDLKKAHQKEIGNLQKYHASQLATIENQLREQVKDTLVQLSFEQMKSNKLAQEINNMEMLKAVIPFPQVAVGPWQTNVTATTWPATPYLPPPSYTGSAYSTPPTIFSYRTHI